MTYQTRIVVLAASVWACVALSGCGSNASKLVGCVAGQTAECSCSDGTSSIKTCQPTNTYGDCACGSIAPTGITSSSGGPGVSSSGSGTPGGMPMMGKGVAGMTGQNEPPGKMPGTGGQGPMTAGTGGEPAPMATGGTSGGGTGGTGSGTGGTLGGTGGRTGGGQAGTGATGAPAYAACTASTACMNGLACVNTTRSSGAAAPGYCAPTCLASTCPMPSSGNVKVSCLAAICVLGSCENADCPEGMHCVQTKVANTSLYSCEYPAK